MYITFIEYGYVFVKEALLLTGVAALP